MIGLLNGRLNKKCYILIAQEKLRSIKMVCVLYIKDSHNVIIVSTQNKIIVASYC